MTRFQLDDSQQTVIGPEGVPLHLRPQSYQVLSYLLDKENIVVSKNELFEEVWGSVVVTDDSVTQCISDIRKLLGPNHRKLLQTVPKKGYRLLSRASLDEPQVISRLGNSSLHICWSDESLKKRKYADSYIDPPLSRTGDEIPVIKKGKKLKTETISIFPPALTNQLKIPRLIWVTTIAFCLLLLIYVNFPPTKYEASKQPNENSAIGPSIIVYPLKSVNQQGTDYFSEGVSADIILALNRLSNLRVLPFHIIQKYQVGSQYSQAIVDEFDPQYALTGSVWREADRVRLNIELTKTDNGRLMWSERYDEVLTDVFELQQTIARNVATALSVNLSAIEMQRIFRQPTENMEAYDYVLTGRSKFRLRNRNDNLEARAQFNKAIELDPDYAEAYAGLGDTYVEEAMFGYTEWPDEALTKALELAHKAVKLDDTNAEIIGFLALVYFRHDKFDLATIEVDRALLLNPNNPDLYILKGLLLSREGLLSEAIEHLEYARQFDPEIKSGWTELGGLYYLNGDVEDAILTFERGLSVIPHMAYVHVMLAAGYAELGKLEHAKKSAKRVLQIAPFFDSQEFSRYSLFRTEEQRSRLRDSLAKAGLE